MKIWNSLHSYFLKNIVTSSYVLSRRAEGLLRFNLVLLIGIPCFLLAYLIFIPHRLPVAAPPMLIGILTASVSLVILRRGNSFAAGQFLAASIALILIAAQFLKVLDPDFKTSFSSFLYLFPVPVLIVALFGRLSWIIPIALLMMLADGLFFALVYTSPGGNPITAQVGLASSVIALILSTALLYLLRTIVDGAITRVEALNLSLSRFVPAEFLRLLNRRSVEEIALGESREATMSVLFSDIRDFTSLAEGNTPETNFKFINDYLKRMGPVIRDHDGFIDKYIGDGILALFERADDAVRAGLAMLVELDAFNQDRPEPTEIGIGIHTGRIMLGTIGEELRMENTVIGDTVNSASRIEALTKAYRTRFLVSRDTLQAMQDRSIVQARLIDITLVKGKRKPLYIHEIVCGESEDVMKAKIEGGPLLEKGVTAVRSGDYIEGKNLFEEYLGKYPFDRTAKVHLQRCARVFNQFKGKSIFEKYGDISTVANLVEIFYEKILRDDLLSDFFTHSNMTRLKGHQTRFIAMLMGAPIRFDTRALEYAHAHLPITPLHFKRVGTLLESALAEGGMETEDIDSIMSRIASFERVIVSRN
ncbi:MAG: hypothetical protein JNM27_22880 [Leptospirales bacterium]|nr:hypothetical protein [Leptospirales bacterium]